jgi:hypothetical protein
MGKTKRGGKKKDQDNQTDRRSGKEEKRKRISNLK